MKRVGFTIILILIYLISGLLIMGSVNNLTTAKWFDSGLDLIYGTLVIYLSLLLFYAYKITQNKLIIWVFSGFWIIVLSRIVQIYLQELHLKTNYQLSILPWSWAGADLLMVIGFLLIVKGLWGIKND